MSTANAQPLSRDKDRSAEKRESTTLDSATITRHFMKYTRTFQSLDPRRTLRHLHLPLAFFDGRDMRVLSTAAEVEEFLTMVMDNLASRGYARSDIEELWVYPLGANVALVSVARARYTAKGDEIDCIGETYTLLREADGEWRIAMAVVHDAPNVLRARPRWRRE
jgi:ketosteroid isomerase-like protein